MKKIYVNPEVLFVQVNGQDIITSSPYSLNVYNEREDLTLDNGQEF